MGSLTPWPIRTGGRNPVHPLRQKLIPSKAKGSFMGDELFLPSIIPVVVYPEQLEG